MPDNLHLLRDATEERLDKYREAILATAAARVTDDAGKYEQQQENQARDAVLGAIDAENEEHYENGVTAQASNADR